MIACLVNRVLINCISAFQPWKNLATLHPDLRLKNAIGKHLFRRISHSYIVIPYLVHENIAMHVPLRSQGCFTCLSPGSDRKWWILYMNWSTPITLVPGVQMSSIHVDERRKGRNENQYLHNARFNRFRIYFRRKYMYFCRRYIEASNTSLVLWRYSFSFITFLYWVQICLLSSCMDWKWTCSMLCSIWKWNKVKRFTNLHPVWSSPSWARGSDKCVRFRLSASLYMVHPGYEPNFYGILK